MTLVTGTIQKETTDNTIKGNFGPNGSNQIATQAALNQEISVRNSGDLSLQESIDNESEERYINIEAVQQNIQDLRDLITEDLQISRSDLEIDGKTYIDSSLINKEYSIYMDSISRYLRDGPDYTVLIDGGFALTYELESDDIIRLNGTRVVQDKMLNSPYRSDGNLIISDQMGNYCAYFDENGRFSFARLTEKSEQRIKNLIGLSGIIISDSVFGIIDNSGNMPVYVDRLGQIGIKKFTPATEQRILDLIGPVVAIPDKIKDKNISIIGDSISTYNGAAGIDPTDTYIGRLIAIQNCNIFVNAVSGSCIATGGLSMTDFTDDSRWSTLNESDPDIILIEGGINDFLQDIALGSLGDTSKSDNFFGALDYLYKNIMTESPNARVFHMTPVHTKSSQGGGLVPEFNGQNFLSDYVDAIYKVAGRYGVGVIDTNRNSGITCYNIGTLSTDNVHFKESGHLMVYHTIVNETNIQLT